MDRIKQQDVEDILKYKLILIMIVDCESGVVA